MPVTQVALIVGSGQGLSASLARLFAREDMRVVLAARNVEKLAPLMKATGATAYPCDASDPAAVEALFAKTASDVGVPDLVVYNASNRGGRKPVTELDPDKVRTGILVTCFGGFLVGQAAAKAMLARGSGSILRASGSCGRSRPLRATKASASSSSDR